MRFNPLLLCVALLLAGCGSMAKSDGAPPAGATALFLGDADLAQWDSTQGGEPKWTAKEGVVTIVPGAGGIQTKQKFTNFRLHVEFNIKPQEKTDANANTQIYGNSGVYLQRRYEVQILDSAGRNPPANNDCGAIYKTRAPDKNAALPAGQWQTFDITFHAPKWDGDKKTANARISVIHNGVKIHDDVEVPAKTGAGQPEAPAAAPIELQEHGNVVSFRNVWLVPLQ
jgi:hypothetical protein